MSCEEVREHLADRRARSAEVERHLAACAACAAVAAERAAPAADLPDLLAAVEADQASERGPRAWLRSRPSPERLALALMAVVGPLIVAVLGTGRPDLPVYPAGRFVVELSILSVLMVGAAALALRPLHRPAAPIWGAASLLGAAVLLPLLPGGLPMAHDLHPASVAGAGADLAGRAAGCFAFGVAAGLPALLMLGLVSRTGRPPRARAALAAAAAGLAGLVALAVHCPITQPVHLLLGHGPVVLALVLAISLPPRASR